VIREARPQDAAPITALWNVIIRETTATFNAEEKTVAEVADLIAERHAQGFAFFVAELDGAVVGFATTFPFRGGVGYRYTAEYTIHLAVGAQRQGIGQAMVTEIVDHATASGLHSLWAGISGENEGAVAFHARCGFSHAARLSEVGYKFGRWFDLVLMQRRL